MRANNIKNTIVPIKLCFSNKDYGNRYNLENVLLHEMCHVYQVNRLCENDLNLYLEDSKKGSGSSGHGPLFFQAADLVNKSPNNKEGYKITQYSEEGSIKNQKIKNLTGWFVCKPSLFLLLVACVPDTYRGHQVVVDNDPIHIFKYKDLDIKTELVDIFGTRKDHLITYNFSKLESIVMAIKKGELESVRNSTDNIELFIGKNLDKGRYQFVATKNMSRTKALYSDIHPVKMNYPYDILKNMILPEVMDLYRGAAFRALEAAIDKGVYSLDKDIKDFIKSENKEYNKDGITVDDLEEVQNIDVVREISDTEFILEIV